MHFSTLPPLLSPLLLLLTTPALSQDYNTVLTDISAIKSNTSALSMAVTTVTPGILGVPSALQVQVDAVTLSKTISHGASDASASPPFGGAGSLAVGLALVDLQGTVRDALANTASKNASFGGLGPVVLASLYALKDETTGFSDAVVAKLDSFEAALAPGIVSAIEGYFNEAILAYGGQGTFAIFSALCFLMGFC